MGTPSSLDIGFIFGLAQEIQSLQDEDGEHKEVDAESGQSLLVEDVNPETSKTKIGQREEEINPGEDSSAGRQVIADEALSVKVVHSRSNVHRNFKLLLIAVGEDKIVLIGVLLDVFRVEGIGVIERIKGVNRLDKIGLKNAGNLAVFELLKDVEPGIEGAEEEANLGKVELGVGERNLGDAELKAAGMGKAELIKGDKWAVVIADLRESDLGK